MKLCGIYKIESKAHPERVYVGSSVNISDRWKRHLTNLKLNKHDNQRLQNHYNKYGIADLMFTVLKECEKAELIHYEQHFIDTLNPYFNICRIAGITLGYKHSKIIRLQMSKSHKGKKHSADTCKKIGEANRVRVITEETREKFRNRIPYNKGKSMPQEQRDKISKSHKKSA